MKFERQDYQEDCVNNIMEVLGSSSPASIDIATLRENLVELHRSQQILHTNLEHDLRLDILMETGTGKTFTYLKTMYEMNKRFGTTKFIIFVPRIAIRAGIVQNIDLTADYFFQEYGKRIKRHIYGGKGGLSQVKDYIRNGREFSVLILTSASIAVAKRDRRILTSPDESLFGSNSFLDAIQELSPVIFLDEPHLLKGDAFTDAYKTYFSKSLLLRFGATFPEGESKLSNVIYTLDSVTAFRDYLVKGIAVEEVSDGETSIKFYSSDKPHKPIKVRYFRDDIEHKAYVDFFENISAITKDNEHDFYIIRKKNNELFLSNGKVGKLSSNHYELTEFTICNMIRTTIKRHFIKEQALFSQGIKVLSLFFIPNIKDFRGDNPRIKNIFKDEYIAQRKIIIKTANGKYKEYLEKDFDETRELRVAGGYFSGDGAGGINKEEKENNDVNLILNEKVKLLSIDEPLRFIFSVWALQEGWDNPNIFNICKLASTDKEIKLRQQVGRGLRIVVNQAGKRQTFKTCGEHEASFYEKNTLDVIVSGQEKDFIENIQQEIIGSSITSNRIRKSAMLLLLDKNDPAASRFSIWLEDKGIILYNNEDAFYYILSPVDSFLEANKDDAPEAVKPYLDMIIKKFKEASHFSITNRNKPVEMIGIDTEKFKKFETLWEKITSRAKIIYNDIDEEALLESIKEAFNKEPIAPIMMTIKRSRYNAQENKIIYEEVKELGDQEFFTKKGSYQKYVTNFAKQNNLPLKFCIKLFNNLDKDKIKNNPRKANDFLNTTIKEEIHQSVIHTIGYKFDSTIEIDAKKRDENNVFYKDGKVRTSIERNKIGKYVDEGDAPDHYLYDKIAYDSDIELEVAQKDSQQQPHGDKITVFAKLPKISIPTPFKSYNPDFAYFIEREQGKQLFLIVETKGYNNEKNIPSDEKNKIKYARRFFEILNEQTEEAEIVYETRINKQSLAALLGKIGA